MIKSAHDGRIAAFQAHNSKSASRIIDDQLIDYFRAEKLATDEYALGVAACAIENSRRHLCVVEDHVRALEHMQRHRRQTQTTEAGFGKATVQGFRGAQSETERRSANAGSRLKLIGAREGAV